jgi:hypothetical protein
MLTGGATARTGWSGMCYDYTTDAMVSEGGGAMYYDSGGCVNWGVSPAYTGYYYADNSAAAASEPPPPATVSPALPTWRNLYDWPNGSGYAGWHVTSSSQPGAYGASGGLGGQPGLWLWPVGGSSYQYSQTNYVEWTYTAPGTTRIANAQLSFSYRNKLLAHHCIEIGLRVGTTIRSLNAHCKPANPPDSQRQVDVSLVDPAANPTSKVLYFRIRVDCGGATTCSKNIPQLDPLSTGAFARLLKADLTLVDDDNPVVTRVSDNVDTFNNTYTVTVRASDAGSGIKSLKLERLGGGVFASADAPCDSTHRTDALDARICPPDFSLTGTLDIGGLEDGTYEFLATAVDVAGNVGTLRWQVVIDRVSLRVTLNPLVATPLDKYTTATQNDFGWVGKEAIPTATTRQTFKWRFELAPGQSLVPLASGGIAVVTATADADLSSADDFSDGSAEDPATVDETDGTDTGGEDDVAADDYDPTTDVQDDATPDDPTMDAVLNAIESAQNEVGDATVDAVVPAPSAKDAIGVAVPVSFTVAGNVVAVTVAHQAASHPYPVVASAAIYDADPAVDDTTGVFAARTAAAVSCPVRPNIWVYTPRGYQQILAALSANPTPCAYYYVGMYSLPDAAKRHIGRVDSSGLPAPNGSWPGPGYKRVEYICSQSFSAASRAAGARFYPVAEFNWGAWRAWVKGQTPGSANDPKLGTRTWRKAGQLFRFYMKREGGPQAGDPANAARLGKRCTDPQGGDSYLLPEIWEIDELPTLWLTPPSGAPQTRIDVRHAADGLFWGLAGYPHRQGAPFVIGRGESMAGIDPFRNVNLRAALKDKLFWTSTRGKFMAWGQEVYANPYKTLVPGSSRQARAKYKVAYELHPALFAQAAAGTADSGVTKPARDFFNAKYFPLVNGYWVSALLDDPSATAALKAAATKGYGYTDRLSLTQMKAFFSTQVYAARRRAAGSETSAARTYMPHLTIGFAWYDGPPNPDVAALATHVAKAVAAAYDPVDGTAKKACFVDTAESWCDGTRGVSGDSTGARRVEFNAHWCAFQTWAASPPTGTGALRALCKG